jgi:hypothetical protein
LAPRWTRAGYKGRLKNAIKKACDLDKPDNANKLDQPVQVEADNLAQPGSQVEADNLAQPGLEAKAADMAQPGLRAEAADNLDLAQPGLRVEADNLGMDDNLDSQDTTVIAGSQSGLESEIDALSILQLAYSDEYMSDVGKEEEEVEETVILTSSNPDVHDNINNNCS